MGTELHDQIGRVFDENRLIGNHEFNDQQYSAMLDWVSDWCLKGCDFRTLRPKTVFAALVEIAKRWKEASIVEEDEANSGFWEYVTKMITGRAGPNQKLYSTLTDIIKHLERSYSLSTVRGGHRYYATLMMHAFAPRKSVYSFFDICYNVFKSDLDFGFTSGDEWVCEIVAEEMKNVLSGNLQEDKLVSIGSGRYSINVGLRSFVLHKDLCAELIRFITDTFANINRLFEHEVIGKETRLEHLITDWWKNKTASEKSGREGGARRIPTVTKQNVVVKYIKNDDEVLLCIPAIRLDDANNKMQVSLYVNNELVRSEEMRTRRGEFVFSTKELTFNLTELLGGTKVIMVRVEITEHGTVIFDSVKNKTTTLDREFILFDSEKEIFSHANKPTNYFVYSTDIDALKTPKELTRVGANFYNIYPCAGESLEGVTKQVFFVDDAKAVNIGKKPCLIGATTDVEWILDDISCSVYKNAVKLMVPENANLRALELRVDNNRYKLHSLNPEQIELNCYRFGLKALGLISECYPTQITLYSYDEEKVLLQESLIVLPNLDVRFNKQFYFGAEERKVNIDSDAEAHEISWGSRDYEAICPFNGGSLVVKIPRLRWRINDGDWHDEPVGKKLWYRHFIQSSDLLEIDTHIDRDAPIVFVKTKDGKFVTINNHNQKFEIGRAIYAIEGQEGIKVHCTVGKEDCVLFNIATKEHFATNPLIYRDGMVYWEVENSFVGYGGHEFFLIAKAEGKSQDPLRIEMGATNSNLGEFRQDVYKVTVKIKDSNVFARKNQWNVIYEGSLIADSDQYKYRFANKKLTLLSANCHNGGSYRFGLNYYLDKLRWVRESENDYYTGRLCKINLDGEVTVLDAMVNEKGVPEKINPVRIELRDSSTLWLVAGYDEVEDDFDVGELFLDKRCGRLCNIQRQDSLFDEINLYKFKEEYV